jgi:hypothetical protein
MSINLKTKKHTQPYCTIINILHMSSKVFSCSTPFSTIASIAMLNNKEMHKITAITTGNNSFILFEKKFTNSLEYRKNTNRLDYYQYNT